jgi:hypothetical protein
MKPVGAVDASTTDCVHREIQCSRASRSRYRVLCALYCDMRCAVQSSGKTDRGACWQSFGRCANFFEKTGSQSGAHAALGRGSPSLLPPSARALAPSRQGQGQGHHRHRKLMWAIAIAR